jgi:hypothetical protein
MNPILGLLQVPPRRTAIELLSYAVVVYLQPIAPSPDYPDGALRFHLDLLGRPSLALGRTH